MDARRAGRTQDRPFYDAPALIQPLAVFGVKDRPSAVAFASTNGYAYSVAADDPRMVAAVYVPHPDAPRLEVTNRLGLKLPPERKEYPAAIVGLAALPNAVCVLTIERGRVASDDLLSLHVTLSTKDTAFHPEPTRTITVTWDGGAAPERDVRMISFIATYADDGSLHVYASTRMRRELFSGRVIGDRLQLRPLALDIPRGDDLSQPLLLHRLPFPEPKYSGWIGRFLVCVPGTAHLYEVRHRQNRLDAVELLSGATPRVSAIAHLAASTDHLGAILRGPGQTIPLILLASADERRIWALDPMGDAAPGAADADPRPARAIYPILGGGTRPLDAGAPENLLDAVLPAVDRLTTLHDAAFAFGAHDQPGWRAMILPAMVGQLGIDPAYEARTSEKLSIERPEGRS